MPRYIALINWTDQGIRNAKASTQRAAQSRDLMAKRGVRLETIYWTIGDYDIVAILDAPDDVTLSAALLELAGAGNLRTKTMRAFDEGEMSQVLGQLG